MDLFSLGLYLRDTREAREITLEKAERDLKIRRRILDSFEQGEFGLAELSPVQVHGFLRNYAMYLGLEGERVILMYEAALANASRRGKRRSSRERPISGQQAEKPPSERRRPSATQPTREKPTTQSRRGLFGRKRRTRRERRQLRENRATQELPDRSVAMQEMATLPPQVIDPAFTPVEFPVFHDRPSSRPRRDVTDTDPALPRVSPAADDGAGRLESLLNALFTVVVALAAIGVIGYVALQIIDLPAPSAPSSVLGQLPQQPTLALVPTLPLISSPPPSTPQDTLGLVQQFDGSGVAVTLRMTQRSWLRVTVDGSPQVNRLALPNEQFEFRGQGIVQVVASNAKALVIIYNGAAQDVFGGRGQQVEINFGTERYDINTGPGFAPTPEVSPTPPATQDPGAVATLVAQQTPTVTEGPSPTPSDTPTITLTPSITFTPAASPTPTSPPTASFTPLPTDTPGPTLTPSITPPPSSTPPPTAPVPPRQGVPNPTATKSGG